MTDQVRPYADSAWQYRMAGWNGVIPLGVPGDGPQKSPVPRGYTGWGGVDPSGADVQAWIDSPHGDLNIGLHLPAGVIAVDVDAHDGKVGATSWQELDLPPTWSSTARGAAAASRHWLYRYELEHLDGRVWLDHPRIALDMLHVGHRYVMAWPSVHPKLGTTVEWYDLDGELYEGVPRVGELVVLTAEQVALLSKPGDALSGTAAEGEAATGVLERFRARDEPCSKVAHFLGRELARIGRTKDGEHIREPGQLYALVSFGMEGCGGVWQALARHREAYVTARVVARGDSEQSAGADWWRQVCGSVGKWLHMHGAPRDKCGCDLSLDVPPFGVAGSVATEVSDPFGKVSESAVSGGVSQSRDTPGHPGTREGTVTDTTETDDLVGWRPEDLTDVLNGTRVAVVPEIGFRRAWGDLPAVPLLYRGKEHAIAGEPESGKTWFALLIASQVLRSGGRVVYVDFEDDAATVVGRLLDLGVLADRLRAGADQFRYVRPETRPRAEEIAALYRFAEGPADLVVFDGWTEGAGLVGLDVMSQDDITAWRRGLVRPALDLGAATLTTDHVVKDPMNRGRYGIGAQHKLAGITGVWFTIQATATWGRGSKGRSKVLITKDRNGGLRPHGKPDKQANFTHIGDLVGDATSGQMDSLDLWPPFDEEQGANPAIRAAIAAVLHEHPEGVTRTTMYRVIEKRRVDVQEELDAMFVEGLVTESPVRWISDNSGGSETSDDAVFGTPS